MKRIRTYIITGAAVILSGVLVLEGIRYYRHFKERTSLATEALPPGFGMLAEIHQPSAVWQKITGRSDLWKSLRGIPPVNRLDELVCAMDSAFISQNGRIRELVSEGEIWLAFYPVEGSRIADLLFLAQLPQSADVSHIEGFIRKTLGDQSIVLQKKQGRDLIHLVNIPGADTLFSWMVKNHLFIGSFKSTLVVKAASQLDSGKAFDDDPAFSRAEATKGHNVDANIYLNHGSFDLWMGKLVDQRVRPVIAALDRLSRWTELDLIVKNDEILLNGYSVPDDTAGNLLNCFHQEPQAMEFQTVLPYNTGMLIAFGFEDFGQFLDDYRIYLQRHGILAGFNEDLTSFQNEYGYDAERQFYPFMGNELVLAYTGDQTIAPLVLVHSKEPLKAAGYIEQVSSPAESELNDAGDFMIRKVDFPGFLEGLFGPILSGFNSDYWVVLKNYLIFSGDPAQLNELIGTFYLQKTLSEEFNYQAFSDNISDRSNIYLYCNIRNTTDQWVGWMNEELKRLLTSQTETLRKFEGLGIQFSYTHGIFYTNMYLKYNPAYQETHPSEWTADLDAPVLGKPHLVRDHKTGKLKIIVFDEMNTMYLIDHTGQIKWKIPLMEAPVSDVHEVDYYKNRKTQYLFNTTKYIYLVDLNGSFVADYPIQLKSPATHGLALFDYDRTKEYRLVVAGADNKLYNYDIAGEPVSGWEKFQANGIVTETPEHLVSGQKDFILITDHNGHVTALNRRGEVRFRCDENFRKAANSRFYINKTNSKGIFLTTDVNGNLAYISESGNVETTAFGEFSPGHWFLYEDLGGDPSNDFIFIDADRIRVFDRMKKPVLEWQFPATVRFAPSIVEGQKGHTLLGVIAGESGRVYLFDGSGPLPSSRLMDGDTPFVTGSLNNDDQINLIICSGSRIYNYLTD
ncbi:MAG: hypothetical protein JW861_01535 [Bacteroidales bacterium]|nr:hypothetical protein [Bacteroidales bacterium]